MSERAAPWVRAVREACGGDLRSVIHLHREGRDVVYVREDLDPATDAQIDHAFETLMFDTVGSLQDERMTTHGTLLCITRRFEEAVELHIPVSETEGVAVALDGDSLTDYDAYIPRLRSVLRDHLPGSPADPDVRVEDD